MRSEPPDENRSAETVQGERRVSLVPDVIRKLVGASADAADGAVEAHVERDAGAGALAQSEEAGAKLTDEAGAVYGCDWS